MQKSLEALPTLSTEVGILLSTVSSQQSDYTRELMSRWRLFVHGSKLGVGTASVSCFSFTFISQSEACAVITIFLESRKRYLNALQ